MRRPTSKKAYSQRAFWKSLNFPLLAVAGFREWADIPTPCPGIEKALFAVWRRNDSEKNLVQLVSRLEEEVKLRMHVGLRCLRRVQPGLPEVLRMQILGAALSD